MPVQEQRTNTRALPDSAAVFAAALSLWKAANARADADGINLSGAYHGTDQFMRQCMRVAALFEEWACRHVAFEELVDVWPYLLEDRFGDDVLEVVGCLELGGFGDPECLQVARLLRLSVWITSDLIVPVSVIAPNPITESMFPSLQVCTMRDDADDATPEPFEDGDDPLDDNFGSPYFALLGVRVDGTKDPIANCPSYEQIVGLAHSLFPGVCFPAWVRLA